MLLEVRLPEAETSYIVFIEKHVDEVKQRIPFTTEARVWKQEVYFETPIEISSGIKVKRVKRGGVYYWPPSKAMCLFYGLTQVYTPAIELGTIVDPLHRLYAVSDGAKIVVEEHRPSSELSQVLNVLERMGFIAATPLDSGTRIVVALGEHMGMRISFSVFVEDYGLHIESEGLARFSEDVSTLVFIHKLRRSIESWAKLIRVDATEDGWIALTAALNSVDELPQAIEELERGLAIAQHILFGY